MARREMTVERYREIKRLLGLGIPLRKIARSVKCTRRTIRQIRDGTQVDPGKPRVLEGPLWSLGIAWDSVLDEVIRGHPLKFIWEEKAKDSVTYVNFWKQFHTKHPEYKQATVVHRVFEPGDRCEVDYAGDTIEWIDIKKGVARRAPVFVGILGFSQLMFATAKEDMKSPRFLDCHNKMFAYFKGVPQIVVPDCLKQGVTKTHLYDPDINEAYQDLAKYYGTAIVPARPGRPKDKALTEGAVKIVMRRFKWKYRNHTFTSIGEINSALIEVCDEINQKPHTRFKVSRFDRWKGIEQANLKQLPPTPFEIIEWKEAKLHPDSHIFCEGAYYSAPHIHRGKMLKVKLTPSHIEIFYDLERMAMHPRERGNKGKYITNTDHLPPNAKAYHEATPQNLLRQAKYLSDDLHSLLEELFQKSTLAHLRRAQGFLREARKEIDAIGSSVAKSHIQKACKAMIDYDKIRVPYFRDLLNQYRMQWTNSSQQGSIQRKQNNPMLRYTQQIPTASN